MVQLCITLGDVKLEEHVLEIGCMNCQQHGFYDPTGLDYPDDTLIDDIADTLTCKQCGFRNHPGRIMMWVRASKYKRTDFPLVLVQEESSGN